ncbi:MAG: hypothetical protein KAH30_00550, partial [Caldisericia bacterium]|nr:hypothetical protein [Caldisericia bacterium]
MGKTLLSFEGTHFIKGTKICDLTNDECDNIKNSIVYLYSLSKEDNLFVYHCLNYINLRDT